MPSHPDGGPAAPYSFWGQDGLGDDFCCTFQEGGIEVRTIVVTGTTADDTLSFKTASGTRYVEDLGGT